MTTQKRKYTWKPDPVDIRDRTFSRPLTAAPPAPLPVSTDLRLLCSAVVDQGQVGSCTANAGISGAFEFLEIKALKEAGPSPDELDPKRFVQGSREFNYYCTRALRGQQGQDGGAFLRDVVKVLNKQGCCREGTWPYNPRLITVQPPSNAYLEATKHRISVYMRLTSLQDMRQCLADGFPFIFGFTVYESFESDAVAKSGIQPMPLPNEPVLGGHAVCAVGYDDNTKHLLVRNSWGSGWALGGYFWMPYDFVTRHASDFWTLRK